MRATPEDVWPTIARMFGEMLEETDPTPVRSLLSMDDVTKSALRLWKNTNAFMRFLNP